MSLYSKNLEYEYEIFYKYQSIPDIELTNTLQEKQGKISGEVRGFVKFDNLEYQPKDLRQYYIIKPLGIEENEKQAFSLEEIIKMDHLSPRNMGVSVLHEVNISRNNILLEDENGNQFFIDRSSGEISIRDVTGDNTTLITDDFDYRDFIKEWLGNKI